MTDLQPQTIRNTDLLAALAEVMPVNVGNTSVMLMPNCIVEVSTLLMNF